MSTPLCVCGHPKSWHLGWLYQHCDGATCECERYVWDWESEREDELVVTPVVAQPGVKRVIW